MWSKYSTWQPCASPNKHQNKIPSTRLLLRYVLWKAEDSISSILWMWLLYGLCKLLVFMSSQNQGQKNLTDADRAKSKKHMAHVDPILSSIWILQRDPILTGDITSSGCSQNLAKQRSTLLRPIIKVLSLIFP